MRISRNHLLLKASILLAGSFLYSCGGNGNLFEPLADKNSTESCKVSVSQNLDKGNYDAVISSSCASDLDKGAAYLGKAGFDIKNVIDRLIDGAKSQESAIDIYLKAMVPDVKPDTINYLDMAEESYSRSGTKDGEFYLAVTQSLKALTLMKSVIVFGSETQQIADGAAVSGGIKTECDLNGNKVPDDVDATACALEMAGSNSLSRDVCKGMNKSIIYNLSFQNKTSSYAGVEFSISATNPGNCPTKFKRVFYLNSTDRKYYLATTSGVCRASDGQDWPCPVEGKSQDFVATVDQSFENMVDFIAKAIPSKDSSDIRKSIEDLRKEACGTDGRCTSQEIANYLQRIRVGK